MTDKELIRRKLIKLTEYLKELEDMKDYNFGDYLDNFFIRRTTERLLQLLVEVAADINGHILVDHDFSPPNNYYESFICLSELNIFSEKFARKIAPSAGLRNRLVHEYEEIDNEIVFKSVKDALKMYQDYIRYIEEHLEDDNKREEIKPNIIEEENIVEGKKAQLVVDEKAILGEGPAWDEKSQRLFWVDIQGKKVHIYDPRADVNKTININKQIGAVVPRAKGGAVLALEDGFAFLDVDIKENVRDKETVKLETEIKVEADNPHTRFNDGKCDPAGRFWAGTMSATESEAIGSLYCLDTDLNVRKMEENITTSNGLAWSPDNTTMYYIDTPTRQIVAYDYDLDTGNISNKRVVVTIPEESGKPDGMNIDEEGMIWVAHWQGYQISRWHPETGEKLVQVEVPVERVTSCCFAGSDLDELYITTASVGLDEEGLTEQPHAGGLFKIKTDVKGSKTYQFQG